MRKHLDRTWLFGAWLSLIALTSSPKGALADEAIALDRFQPAPAGDTMFGVPSANTSSNPSGLNAMVLFDYAHNPLVFRRKNDESNAGVVVGSQLFMHVGASYAFVDRFGINVDLPIALQQSGDAPNLAGFGAVSSPSGAAIGDLRVGLRLRFLGRYHDAFQLALAGYVWFPTGSGADGSFVSDGSLRGMPHLIASGRSNRAVWSVSLGPEIRRSRTWGNVQQGTSLVGGAGLGIFLDSAQRFQLGAEITASTVLQDPGKRTTNAEILVDARYRILGFLDVGVGAGPGIAAGLGTPDVRVIGMIGYSPERKKPEPARPPPPDRDNDAIVDLLDACPDVAGAPSSDPRAHGCPPPPPDRDNDAVIDPQDACIDIPGVASADPTKNGCPPDRDGDRVFDAQDACADVPGVANADPTKNGCPPDNDSDGIIDAEDACIEIPGIKTSDRETNGCPGDTDSDSIRDDKDACPREKGKPDPDPTKNGCPQAVRVTANEIIILQQVQFDTDAATIKKVSDGLLDEVAAVVKEHPEISKLEVQGHTDNKGAAKRNGKLSQSRADAVMKALVKRGVAESRLTAKGYGMDVPIDTNATPEGRQRNRRVEFKIMEKAGAPQN